jgi:hypothetical protein
VDVILVERLRALFKGRDIDKCFEAIAASTNEAYEAGATVVAYAHPWMVEAAGLENNGDGRLIAPMPYCAP